MGALFLVVASILSVFDIVKAKDAEGREVDVNGEYDDADITYVTRLSESPRSRSLHHAPHSNCAKTVF